MSPFARRPTSTLSGESAPPAGTLPDAVLGVVPVAEVGAAFGALAAVDGDAAEPVVDEPIAAPELSTGELAAAAVWLDSADVFAGGVLSPPSEIVHPLLIAAPSASASASTHLDPKRISPPRKERRRDGQEACGEFGYGRPTTSKCAV